MKQFDFKVVTIVLFLLAGLFCPSGAFAQATMTVNGTVTDSHGEPIIGANILVKGTSNGTITDLDGHYTLQAPKGSTLEFKFVGFKTVEKVVDSSTINVTMHEDAVLVDDVVVVGYATGSPKTISGAVQKVGREDMNAGIVNNPLEAIKGKVAGVNIQKTGGDPTASAAIRVRGTTSLSGGNDPLVVIDGVFGDLNMLNAIAPADIESFTILKDASETAQYGSRGASGVIVVTTQKGKGGTRSFSYDGSFGVETVYKNIKMLDAAGYRRTVEDGGYINALDGGASTNFIKEMERTGFTQNHRVSFTGGTAQSNYRASLGIIDQQGIIKDNYMRNYTAKLDVNQLFFHDKIRLEMGMFGSKKDQRYLNNYQKTFYSAASFNPTLPAAQNADGTWPEDPNANEVENPLGRLTIDDKENNSYINIHGKVSWDIIEGLRVSAFGSYTYNDKNNAKYVPNNIKEGIRDNGYAHQATAKSNILMGNISVSYKKLFNEVHALDALVLTEGQKYSYNGFNSDARSFGTNYFGFNNLGAGAIVKYGDVGSYDNSNSLLSFLGRVNYVYDSKYIATVNLRTDGSSKLGKNNKWGFFPSASVAWAMKEESFLKDVRAVNDLKLRVGYGLTGNQDAISAYNSLALMVPTGITTVNGKPTVTYGFSRNANPDLKWETKKMFDVGVDGSFFDNRLSATIDYYNSRTTGLLYNYDVPVPPFVYPSLLANIGKMENNGIEISVTGVPVKTKDMELTISANVAYQKNKLLSLSGTYMGQELNAKKYMNLGGISGAGFIGGNTQVIYQMVGQPLGVFYLPHSDGLIDDGLGGYTYHVVNLDDDPAINIEDGKDRRIAGQAMPKVLLGGNISFRYKDFDIQTQLSGAFGHKIYNGTSLTYMNMNTFPTYNVLPDAPAKNIKDNTVTDYWLERGDYVHIDYVTLGYNVPMGTLKKWVNTLRVTFSVNNLATITHYSGLSPMINSTTVGSNLGIDDKQFYPLTRTYSLGLSINF